jgi:hypothetical protein
MEQKLTFLLLGCELLPQRLDTLSAQISVALRGRCHHLELRLAHIRVVQQHMGMTVTAAYPNDIPFGIDVRAISMFTLAAGEELCVVRR